LLILQNFIEAISSGLLAFHNPNRSLKAGMPLSTETPAPVKKQFFSYLKIFKIVNSLKPIDLKYSFYA
jgi:hypothetical protein